MEKTALCRMIAILNAFAVVVLTSSAAEIVAGPYIKAVKDVAAGSAETQTDAVRADGASGASVVKTGGGAWTLPFANLRGNDPKTVTVTEGTLSPTAGRAPAFSTDDPPAAMQKAALWLDAARGVVFADETAGTVSRWHDRREEVSAGAYGTVYPCADAAPGNARATPVTVHPVRHFPGGDAAIWFRGAQSGSTMAFKSADRSANAAITGIRHVFIVHAVTNCIGAILGHPNGSNYFFIPRTYDASGLTYPYIHYRDAKEGVGQGRGFYDGRIVNLKGQIPTAGRHLVEWHTGGVLAHAGALFDDRGYGNRSGGDDLCEVVLFKEVLSDAERMQISEWLYRKWIGADFGPGAVSIATAPGASVTVNGDTIPQIESLASFSGAGTLAKTGAGAASLSFSGASLFGVGCGWTGRVRVDEGGLVLNDTAPVYDFAGGDNIAVERSSSQVLTISKGAPLQSCEMAKTGSGEIRLEEIPHGVTNMYFSGGRLTLSAKRAPDRAIAAGSAEAEIKSPGFEGLYTAALNSVNKTTLGTSDWKTDSTYARVMDRSRMTDTLWLCDHASPEGSYSLAIKQSGKFSTRVSVPVGGVYDLTFKTCGRTSYAGMAFDIELVDSAHSTNYVGRCIVSPSCGYLPRLFRTPEIAAGTWTLQFRSVTTHDAVACFDDFRMTRVAAAPEKGVYAVPNGGFEGVAPSGTTNAKSFTAANTAEGWTFTDDAGTSYLDTGVVLHGDAAGLFRTFAPNGGSVQLMFVGDAGAAVSSSFTMPSMPAGRYRLRARCANTGAAYMIGSLQNAYSPNFSAMLTVDGTEHALGTTGGVPGEPLDRKFLFPGAVEIPRGATLSIALTQTTATSGSNVAMGLIDDLEFVAADGDAELVDNGDFESSFWHGEANKDTSVTTLANGRARWLSHSAFSYVGSDRLPSSEACADIGQAGMIWRTVEFSETGVHRLVFWTRCRPNYGGNSLKALLWKDGSAVTNEIARTTAIDSTVFTKQDFLFDVTETGTWNLGLQGVNDSGKTDMWTFIDNVSIKKVEDEAAAFASADAAFADITLAAGTELYLDYAGNMDAGHVKLNGRSLRRGTVLDASHPSGLVRGLGTLTVTGPERGTVILVR